MKSILPHFVCGLGLLLFCSSSSAAEKPAPQRPNVLVVVTDDQGYGELSCHGNPVLQTPNLDRLRSTKASG